MFKDEFAKLNFLQNAKTWYTPPVYFFADDGDDDKGGGSGDDNKGDDKGDGKGDQKPETYEIKINGEMKQLTLDEMKDYGPDERGRRAWD
jgi:hypothetical protein